ncbi:hypothetical protein AVEN_143121-1, partial [Araneus ventricosus]
MRNGFHRQGASDVHHRPQWPSGKGSASGRRVPGSKPDSTEDPPCRVDARPTTPTSSRYSASDSCFCTA